MNTDVRPEELIDRIYTVIAGCAALMALFMATEALGHFVTDQTGDVVYWTGRVLMVLALAGFAWVLLLAVLKRSLILRQRNRGEGLDEEGFVPQMTRKAMAISWGVTIIFVSQIDRFLGGLTEGMSARDVLLTTGEVGMSIMLGVFSIAFFALSGFGADESAGD